MQLMVQLGLNATNYETGLKRADSAAKKFGHELSSELGSKITQAFGFAAIEEGIRSTIEWGDKLKNLSVRTGIPVEELQKLEYAANQTETSIDTVVKAVEKFGKSQAEARKEGAGGDLFEAMRRMGLTVEDINNGEFVPNFYKAAEHLKNSENSAQLIKDWTSVAGKNAMELAPAIREGLTGFAAELEHMGGVVPAEQMAHLAEAADNFKRIMVGLRSFMAQGIGNKGAGWLDEIAIALVGAAEFSKTLATTGSLKKAHQASKEIEAEAHEGLALKHADLVEQLKGGGDKQGGKGGHSNEQTDNAKKEALALKEVQRIQERIEEIRRKGHLRELSDKEKVIQLDREIVGAREEAAKKHDEIERRIAAARQEAAKRENAIIAAKTQHLVDSRRNFATPDELRALEEEAAKAKEKLAELEGQRTHAPKEFRDLQLESAKADERVAQLESDRAQAERAGREKEDKKPSRSPEKASSLVDIGNFLGVSGDPARGTNEKLDLIHQDLRAVIKTIEGTGTSGIDFPAS